MRVRRPVPSTFPSKQFRAFQSCGIPTHLSITPLWKKVGHAVARHVGFTPSLARRALDQSNGAMFLNRKLIVQLSTSRFRPQPKEANHALAPTPKQLMVMGSPTSSSSALAFHHLTNGSSTNGGGSSINPQQPNSLTQQYANGNCSERKICALIIAVLACRNQLRCARRLQFTTFVVAHIASTRRKQLLLQHVSSSIAVLLVSRAHQWPLLTIPESAHG